MADQVMVTIEISLEDIGIISALLDHYKPRSAVQGRWDSLFKGTHQLVYGTYMYTGSIREITIPKRKPI